MKKITTDFETTVTQLKERMKQFVDERDWNQFHSPKNLSIALATETAELLEFFKWCTLEDSYKVYETNKEKIEHEVADVMLLLLALCNTLDMDLTQAINRKLALTEKNYPVEKCKGKSDKYREL